MRQSFVRFDVAPHDPLYTFDMVDWALFTINIDPFFRATFRRISRETSRSKICTYIFESSNFESSIISQNFEKRNSSCFEFPLSLSLLFFFLSSYPFRAKFRKKIETQSKEDCRSSVELSRSQRLHYDLKTAGTDAREGRKLLGIATRTVFEYGDTDFPLLSFLLFSFLFLFLFPFKNRERFRIELNFFTSPRFSFRDTTHELKLSPISWKLGRFPRN